MYDMLMAIQEDRNAHLRKRGKVLISSYDIQEFNTWSLKFLEMYWAVGKVVRFFFFFLWFSMKKCVMTFPTTQKHSSKVNIQHMCQPERCVFGQLCIIWLLSVIGLRCRWKLPTNCLRLRRLLSFCQRVWTIFLLTN